MECPVCNGPTRMVWPERLPSIDDLTAMYVAASYAESGGNLTAAARAIGMTFNTAKKHLAAADEAAKRHRYLSMSDAERYSLLRDVQSRHRLVTTTGLYLGDWAELAKSGGPAGSIVWDIRLHERVRQFDGAVAVPAGARPFMVCGGLGFELTEAPFGLPVACDSVCVFAQAGPRQVIGALVSKVTYDKADEQFRQHGQVLLPPARSGGDAGADAKDGGEHVRSGGAVGVEDAQAGSASVEGEPAEVGDRQQMPHPADRNVPVLDRDSSVGPAGGGSGVEGGGEIGRGDVEGGESGGVGDHGGDR